MKKLLSLLLSLTLLCAPAGCGTQLESSNAQTAPPATPSAEAAAKPAIVERMETVQPEDLKYITSSFDRGTAGELAAALNGAAAHAGGEAPDPYFYYSLEAYLSGGPEGWSSEDERFTLYAGLEENLVDVLYVPGHGGEGERMTFTDETLYRLIRSNYRTEADVDQTALERFRPILELRAETLLGNSNAAYGGAGFTGFEITQLRGGDTCQDGEPRYTGVAWGRHFPAGDVNSVPWAGGMYLDAEGRVGGYEQYTYFVVQDEGTPRELYRFLPWDIYAGETEELQRQSALNAMERAFQPEVQVQWGDDALPELKSYETFVARTDGPVVQLVFSADHTLWNFQVLSIFFKEMDGSRPVYQMDTLYRLDALTPEKPLLVETVFIGDIPNNAVSYVDNSGMTRVYAVGQSGEDGSLQLIEI
jgi:hypothetical protein